MPLQNRCAVALQYREEPDSDSNYMLAYDCLLCEFPSETFEEGRDKGRHSRRYLFWQTAWTSELATLIPWYPGVKAINHAGTSGKSIASDRRFIKPH